MLDSPAAFAEAQTRFQDVRWRLNNLYWITDKDGRRIRFETNWAQERLFGAMHTLNLILKARQLGMSSFVQIFMLDQCLFNSNIRAGVIAQNREAAEIIFRDKIKYAYDNLPEGLRAAQPYVKDTANELLLRNNSSIRVGTSMRSGTLQLLHVSEYGKICAQYPEKAREIRTGALNTLQAGQLVFIESTAEGQEGHFFDLCQAAQEAQRRDTRLTELDFKFHFFPWWQEPGYALEPAGVEVSSSLDRYFDELGERFSIHLSPRQKAWYAKKLETQGADMKREFPSTPDEAFAAAVEGAYYGDLLAQADAEKRITKVPHEPSLPVHTMWDLGLDDCQAIWFLQREGLAWNFIDYYENSGEALPHYVKQLDRRPYRYAEHILPHDGATRDRSTAVTPKQILEALGLRNVKVMPRRPKEASINGVRQMLPKAYFDAEKCADGLKALRSYRREWNEALGTWRDQPRHDWASHAADSIAEGAAADPQNDTGWKPLKFSDKGIT